MQGQQLAPDGMWSGAGHLSLDSGHSGLALPRRKHFCGYPRGLFSVSRFGVRAASTRTVKAGITVLNILWDSTPPLTQRPGPSGPQHSQESPSPPSCPASLF